MSAQANLADLPKNSNVPGISGTVAALSFSTARAGLAGG